MYKKILIPVAPDHMEAVPESLAVARRLAGEGAALEALTVLETVPLYVAAEVPPEVYERSCREMERRLLEAFRERPEVKVTVVTGSPASRIVDAAREAGADLIVIRSHRPGLQDWFLGSTAGRIVRHAPCAVHVLR